MTGLSDAAGAFFDDLEADNSAGFWAANKARFERDVKAPFAGLLAALETEFGPFKTFRLHRDTRFSADKAPLKTMHGAVDRTSGLRYLHIDREGMLLVCGAHAFAKEDLAAWRLAVADETRGAALADVLASLAAAGIEVAPGGIPPLSGTPRGFAADHPRIGFLRWKGCMAQRRVPRVTISGQWLPGAAGNFWRATAVLHRWLATDMRAET